MSPAEFKPTADKRNLTVALVGNPNTGKTTLFNALAGMRQRVGNYPGVTVEMKKGRMAHGGRTFEIIDLPGTYSLAPRSPDEMVAVDLLLGRQSGEPRPDVVVSIVDASNLERNLYLTTQVLEMGEPVVVALNMVDVAEAHGLRLDPVRLSGQLGVPVVPIQANKGIGLEELKQAVAEAAGRGPPLKRPTFPAAFEAEVQALAAGSNDPRGETPEFLLRRLLLDVGGHTERRLSETWGGDLPARVAAARKRLADAKVPVPAVEAKTRYGWIREVTAGCIQRPTTRPVTWTDTLDRVLTHRVWGTVIFLVVMALVFQSIFTWASPLTDVISAGKDALSDWVGDAMGKGRPLTSLVTGGIIEGVGAVLVFLPQILILFLFIAVLEDCGYMARAAFLMDRLMSRCGLSGKSFIPLLSSVACAVPGILATRVIENRRDRLATILVAPLMSCSARLPLYILIIATFLSPAAGYSWWVPGLTLFGMYMIGFVVAPLVALVLKRTLLRGEPPVFVMEMPVYKRPAVGQVLRRMFDSGWAFVKRAGTVILASMILVWALLYFPVNNGNGESYDALIAEKNEKADEWKEQADAAVGDEKKELEKRQGEVEDEANVLNAEWKAQSYLGRMGKAIEPAVRPLGWDWKIGVAAIASFPAREVVVGTLGLIYGVGEVDAGELSEKDAEEIPKTPLAEQMASATFEDTGEKVFTPTTAVSLMVFFALCCQCASTLAVIRRETGTWRWPAFTFVYMTVLAYVAALVVYQVGSRL